MNEQSILTEISQRVIANLPNSPAPYHRIWTNGESILCPTEEEANAIADFIDASGLGEATTGYYDPDEDEKADQRDECTGYYYVCW
jgi:hypothetical protein